MYFWSAINSYNLSDGTIKLTLIKLGKLHLFNQTDICGQMDATTVLNISHLSNTKPILTMKKNYSQTNASVSLLLHTPVLMCFLNSLSLYSLESSSHLASCAAVADSKAQCSVILK